MGSLIIQQDIKVTHSSANTLCNLLTKTKTTPPTQLTPNTIYEISSSQFPSKYTGQTYRPLIHRMKECTNDATDSTMLSTKPQTESNPPPPIMPWPSPGTNRSPQIPYNTISTWPDTTHRHTLTQDIIQPSVNRTDGVPILPRIASSQKTMPSGISVSSTSEVRSLVFNLNLIVR